MDSKTIVVKLVDCTKTKGEGNRTVRVIFCQMLLSGTQFLVNNIYMGSS